MRRFFLVGFAPIAAILVDCSSVNAQAAVDLGTVWNEQEAGWQGVWTRVGRTNTFQAVWTKENRIVRANLQMAISGNIVSITRDDTYGPGMGRAGCEYTGTVTGNVVAGDYNCSWSRAAGKWKAIILR